MQVAEGHICTIVKSSHWLDSQIGHESSTLHSPTYSSQILVSPMTMRSPLYETETTCEFRKGWVDRRLRGVKSVWERAGVLQRSVSRCTGKHVRRMGIKRRLSQRRPGVETKERMNLYEIWEPTRPWDERRWENLARRVSSTAQTSSEE